MSLREEIARIRNKWQPSQTLSNDEGVGEAIHYLTFEEEILAHLKSQLEQMPVLSDEEIKKEREKLNRQLKKEIGFTPVNSSFWRN